MKIKPIKLISELSAGAYKFTAHKTENDILFNFYVGENKVVTSMGKNGAKFFRSCITDVLKREGESLV